MADEAAQIVVAVRAASRPESTSGYQVSARARKGKQNVPNTTVLQVEHEGKKTHNLLDCLQGGLSFLKDSNACARDLWGRRLQCGSCMDATFQRHSLLALVVFWILTIVKARRRVPPNRASFPFVWPLFLSLMQDRAQWS